MIKTPLRYPGGKSKALKFILPLIPDFQEYREPFIGGGSVFIALKQEFSNKKFWINDLYKNLFCFWLNCADNSQELINLVIKWKKEFREGKKLYQFLKENIDNFNDIEKGASFFIFNRITFSGTTESGGYSEMAFQKRFTDSSIERVKNLGTILTDTKITNYDYQQVVETEGKNVFIFLDPPYYSATKSALYGKNGNLHKQFDHKRFAEIMKESKHKWLITYDDSDYIRNLFSFANIIEWDLHYGMRNVNINNPQKGQELFIANYDIFPQKKVTQLELFTA